MLGCFRSCLAESGNIVSLTMRKSGIVILGVLVLAGLCFAAFYFMSGNGVEGPAEDEGKEEPAAITLAPVEKAPPPEDTQTIRNGSLPPGRADPLAGVGRALDSFLRAKTWKDALPYIYRGEELASRVEDYYKEHEYEPLGNFSRQLFQIEEDPEMDGPYWVYLISMSPEDQGFPVIVREEDGEKKVDWEMFAEFRDRSFARYVEEGRAEKSTFRVVAERKRDYYAPDKDAIGDLDDYFIFTLNAPYGRLDEFSIDAFVDAESEVAVEMGEVLGPTDSPLAVVLTVEKREIANGVDKYVIVDYVTEGWFVE